MTSARWKPLAVSLGRENRGVSSTWNFPVPPSISLSCVLPLFPFSNMPARVLSRNEVLYFPAPGIRGRCSNVLSAAPLRPVLRYFFVSPSAPSSHPSRLEIIKKQTGDGGCRGLNKNWPRRISSLSRNYDRCVNGLTRTLMLCSEKLSRRLQRCTEWIILTNFTCRMFDVQRSISNESYLVWNFTEVEQEQFRNPIY